MIKLSEVLAVLFGLIIASNFGIVLMRCILITLDTKPKEEYIPVLTALSKVFDRALFGTTVTLFLFWLLPTSIWQGEIELTLIFWPNGVWRMQILIITFGLSAIVSAAGLIFEEILMQLMIQINKLEPRKLISLPISLRKRKDL